MVSSFLPSHLQLSVIPVITAKISIFCLWNYFLADGYHAGHIFSAVKFWLVWMNSYLFFLETTGPTAIYVFSGNLDKIISLVLKMKKRMLANKKNREALGYKRSRRKYCGRFYFETSDETNCGIGGINNSKFKQNSPPVKTIGNIG